MKPGDEVTIGYLFGPRDAVLVEYEPPRADYRYVKHLRQWLVEQDYTCGNGSVSKIRYLAAEEFIVPRGETPPIPFVDIYARKMRGA